MRQWYSFYSQRITNWHEHSAKMALLNWHEHSAKIEESNCRNNVTTIAVVAHSSIPMKVKSKMDTKVRKPNRTPQIANKRTTRKWFSLFLYINQKCGVVLPIFNQNAELYFRFSIKIWSSTSDFQSIFGAKAQKNP